MCHGVKAVRRETRSMDLGTVSSASPGKQMLNLQTQPCNLDLPRSTSGPVGILYNLTSGPCATGVLHKTVTATPEERSTKHAAGKTCRRHAVGLGVWLLALPLVSTAASVPRC